jgi:hypothetical protein
MSADLLIAQSKGGSLIEAVAIAPPAGGFDSSFGPDDSASFAPHVNMSEAGKRRLRLVPLPSSFRGPPCKGYCVALQPFVPNLE